MVKGKEAQKEAIVSGVGLVGSSTTTTDRFAFPLTTIVNTCRLQNGLRHSLYQRYRHYCSRRLLRLRRHLGVKQVKFLQFYFISLIFFNLS
jgi:hypothetical protein